jgi:transketolase
MSANDLLCINTIRTLSIDAVQKANSGHPGLPLGAAPMAWVLWSRHLRHNPKDPAWPNRDRFVLSAGHGSMLLYSLLHLTGYDVSLDELLAFRQWGSKTPGHPETFMTPGVEATTGPLGQGSANAVGMAIAERYLATRYNKPGHTVVDHFTYALVSDGDLMEGVNAEAASLAGHLGLGKLIYLYDANDVTLDGPADMHFTEDVCKRYEAYGWQVLRVEDGNRDLDAIDNAIRAAQNESARPSLIWIHTTIGFGSPNKGGTAEAHGSPLGPDEVKLTKQALGWEADKSFLIPDAALAEFRRAVDRGAELQADWTRAKAAWAAANPELGREWDLRVGGSLPEGWDADLPAFPPGKAVATRSASGKALNVIAKQVPWLLGGDADLGGSTKTLLDGAGSFDRTGAGRNIHFGVREHAMGSICNGMAYGGGMRPYAATFFVFSDYMRPAVRLAAMNHLPVVYVWTHDSIGLGEDGPTHQPVEHLASLRAMPGLVVLRPADANETVEAWRVAMKRGDGPTALVLSRQDLPVLDRAAGFGPAAGVAQGAYVLRDPSGGAPQAVIIGTGAEVHVALAAADALAADGVRARVVSMPSWELFAAQPQSYRDQVLPPALAARVSIEAGATFGWERWLGGGGAAIGVDKYGASAPAKVLFEKYGLTPAAVAGRVKSLLGR